MGYERYQKAIPEQKAFIRKIEELREIEGISRCALSIRAFENPTTYFLYCNHKSNMNITSLKKLAEAFGKKLVIKMEEGESNG